MNKCLHGVYIPHGDEKAFACQLCNPAGNAASADGLPVFNRRGSMALTVTGKLPKCPNCNEASILALSRDGVCKNCGSRFEIVAPTNLRANNVQPGICPDCGSGIHFVKDRKTWECADCGTQYRSPKRVRE